MIDYAEAFAAREARLRSPNGWLTLAGKIFFGQGTTPVVLPDGTLAGTLRLDGNVVRFEATPGELVTIDGAPIRERILTSDARGKADALLVGDFVLEVMERGDTFALRIRDPKHPAAATIDRYPIDPTWNVAARLETHPHGLRTVEIDFEGSIRSDFVSPGTVVFERGGTEHRLLAVYEDASQRRLFLLFRDTTSGNESYPLGRFVYAPAATELMIDFNLAMLPGCAFTEHATCPIPPRENRLTIAVRAGERSVAV